MLINLTNVSVTPHASLQYTWLRTGSYTSKLNGLNAFHTEARNRHIGSVSAGLKMKADFKFEEGRILRPRMDVLRAAQLPGHGSR